MGIARKNPIDTEFHRWFKDGDVDSVVPYGVEEPADDSPMLKLHEDGCGCSWEDHGWISTLEGGHIVCPGDYILTGIDGEHWAVKPTIFDRTYTVIEP